MNLYKTTAELKPTTGQDGDPDQGVTKFVNWTGTQADARADRVRLKKDGYDEVFTYDVNVPTSKGELLAFLNENNVGQ